MQDSRSELSLAAVVILLTAAGFLCCFSTTTSFLFQGQSVTDSAIFQLVGKSWAEGRMPYRDIFDNKGPLVYLFNAIPYACHCGRYGILFIQWLHLCATLCISFLFFRLCFRFWQSLLFMVFSCASLTLCTSGGNSVEEYVLPWLMASFYTLLLWLRSPEQRLPRRYAFLYGLTFGISLLTRLTNALGLAGALLVVGIYLMTRHRWKELRQAIGAFVLGCVLPVVPFLVYFASQQILSDWWYASVAFNMEYVRSSDFEGTDWMDLFKWLKYYSPCYLLLALTLISKRRRSLPMLTLAVSAAFLLVWYVFGQRYEHYGILSLPYFCIIILMLRHHVKWLAAYLLVVAAGTIYEVRSAVQTFSERDQMQPRYSAMIRRVPGSERSSLMGYNVGPGFYYYNDLMPVYPYFCMQEMGPAMSRSLLPRIRRAFASGKAQWIIVQGDSTHIEDILRQQYVLEATDKDASLRLFSAKKR